MSQKRTGELAFPKYMLVLTALFVSPILADAKSQRTINTFPSSKALLREAENLPSQNTDDFIDACRDAVFALQLEGADYRQQLDFIESIKAKHPQIAFEDKFEIAQKSSASAEIKTVAALGIYTPADGPVNGALIDRAEAEVAAGNLQFALNELKKLVSHSDLSQSELKKIKILRAWIATTVGDRMTAVECISALESSPVLTTDELIAATWLRGRVAYLSDKNFVAARLEKRALNDRIKYRAWQWAQFIDNLIDFAYASTSTGSYVAAESALCKVISMTNTTAPELADARTLLALCYMRSKHADLAAYTFHIAMREMDSSLRDNSKNFSPSYARAYLNAGKFENLRDNKIRARRYFEQSRKIVDSLNMSDTRLGREIASVIEQLGQTKTSDP